MSLVIRLNSVLLIAAAAMLGGCVTQTDPSGSARQNLEPSIIAVSAPDSSVPRGSVIGWHAPAIGVYKDERLDSNSMQYFIEQSIRQSIADIGMTFVESGGNPQYAIAYTAGLESSLDDTEVLQRFGLLPGNMRIPRNNPEYEKGTLVIYLLDRNSGEAIWRSAMQAAVDLDLDNDTRKERVGTIVHEMFKTLPVKN